MDAYDVIIIGTGAGGGTLARHLAPSGKRILLLERGDWLPREPQNWDTAGRVRRQPLRLRRHLVRRERQAVPAADPLLRRRRDQALRRRALPAAQGGLRRAPPPRRHLAGLADLLRRPRAVLHARGAALRGARRARARIRPSRRRARRTRSRPSRTSPGSSSSPTSSRRPATTRSTRRAGSCLDEGNMPFSHCVRCSTCDGFPCLVHAKSDAEVLGVRPALEHANVTLLTNARAVKLETDAPGTTVTEVVVERDGSTERYAGSIVVAACGAANTAKLLLALGERQASERPRERLGPGRPELHVPREPGRARALAGREPDRLPEDARPQRLLLRRRRLRLPAREHPDDRQVAAGDVPRREADRDEARARVDARADGQARDRLLALDRGSAAAREPGDARPRRQHPPRLHARPTTRRRSGSTRSSSRSWASWT